MVTLDAGTLVRMVEELQGGRAEAWPVLITLLHPHIETVVATSHSMGPLRESVDHRRNAVTDALAKLAKNNYRALELLAHWLVANPEKTAGDWLRIVVTNVVREYVSKQLGGSSRPEQPTSAKRLLHTLASPLPEDDRAPARRPPVTDQQTARQILDYAAEHLSAAQLRALAAWLRQADFAEIGRDAGLTSDHERGGERLVRSALGKLRRQFADDTD